MRICFSVLLRADAWAPMCVHARGHCLHMSHALAVESCERGPARAGVSQCFIFEQVAFDAKYHIPLHVHTCTTERA